LISMQKSYMSMGQFSILEARMVKHRALFWKKVRYSTTDSW
jgi:hypothetical protein